MKTDTVEEAGGGEGADLPAAVHCPVCNTPANREDQVACGTCQTRHHRRCWGFHKGCAHPGCGARGFVPVVAGVTPGGPVLELGYYAASPEPTAAGAAFLAGILLWVYNAPLAFAALGALLVPSLLRTSHRLDPETRCIERRRSLGPFPLWRRRAFLPFHEVAELELRPVEGGPRTTHFEVLARDRQDTQHLLGVVKARSVTQATEAIDPHLEALDTVLALPPGAA